MKAYVFFLFSIILNLVSFGQDKSCKSLYTGKFRVLSEDSGTTIIKRTKYEQVEINDELDYEIIFSIKWIDDCTYELRPKKIIKGDPSIMGDGTYYLRTEIKIISYNYYTAETTSNFSDIKMRVNVEIVR